MNVIFRKSIDYIRAFKLFSLTSRTDLFDRLPQTKWYRSALEQFVELLHPMPSDKFLDIGCGAGWNVLWTSKHVKQAIGLDRSEPMIKRANFNLRSGNYNNASFVVGDAMKLPFPDNEFDLVTGTMLLPVLSNPEQAITEMIRVLRQGGKLGIFVPSPSLTPSNAKSFAKEHALKGFDHNTLITWSLTGNRFSEADLHNLVATHLPKNVEVHQALNGLALMCIIEK